VVGRRHRRLEYVRDESFVRRERPHQEVSEPRECTALARIAGRGANMYERISE
jgi:hypothetical protein